MKALVQSPDKQLKCCVDITKKRYSDHLKKVYAGVNKTTRDSQKYQARLVQKWLELKKCVSLSTGLNEGTFPVDQPFKVHKSTADALQDNPTAVERLVPMDPRLWTPTDVRIWLSHMTETHSIQADPSFFQMNGRGLCLMSLKGFQFRVPVEGKLLYDDFRERLKICLLATRKETIKPTNQKLCHQEAANQRTSTVRVGEKGTSRTFVYQTL
ncbi:uncharacterized protein [Asterias amurensis]|uniref:uncharacterized protein isoform X1 n=1 Tax=Asterias amurensis TaxID=7602 RepID=UPI003AB4FA2F